MMTKRSMLLVKAVWLIALLAGTYQGVSLPGSELANAFGAGGIGIVTLWGVPFLFFSVAAFLQRRTLSETSLPFLASAVDARFGEGAYGLFMADLRPTLLLMSFALVSGGVGLVVAYGAPTNAANGAKLISGFFFSGGLGLLVAYLLSIRFPPTLR